MLIDANLLIYAAMRSMPQHPPARDWLDEALSAQRRVGIPWPSLLAFLRIVTNPRIFSSPPPMETAWNQVQSWLAVPSVWIPQAGDNHGHVLARMVPHVSAPHLVSDAHLAAIAIEHGLTLYTTDGDFARFPGLRWRNPLRS